MPMEGIQPLSISLGSSADAWASMSSATRGVGGMLVQDGEAILIEIMGQRLALPKGAGLAESNLTPGARVHIDFVKGDAGLTLLIRPAGPPESQTAPQAPQTAAQTFPATQKLLAAALESLGRPLQNLSAQDAALNLLPRLMPLRAETVRQVLALFTHQNRLSGDLREMAGLLDDLSRALAQRATGDSALRGLVDDAALLTRQMLVSEAPEKLLKALKEQGEADTRPFEARVARLLQTHPDDVPDDAAAGALRGDLRAQLSRIRDESGLRELLRDNGQLARFEQAVQRVSERLTGTHLQNLHGLDQQYAFLQIPFTPGNVLREARLHLFADHDARGTGRFDPQASSVVLDLETSRLGDLWIELGLTGSACRCRLRATSEKAALALETAAGELETTLAEAGYPHSTVTVGLWNGDRLGATAELLGRFGGMEVEA